MEIDIPEALLLRIKTFCDRTGIAIQEFLLDAIIEKLERTNKEKRKRPRM